MFCGGHHYLACFYTSRVETFQEGVCLDQNAIRGGDEDFSMIIYSLLPSAAHEDAWVLNSMDEKKSVQRVGARKCFCGLHDGRSVEWEIDLKAFVDAFSCASKPFVRMAAAPSTAGLSAVNPRDGRFVWKRNTLLKCPFRNVELSKTKAIKL